MSESGLILPIVISNLFKRQNNSNILKILSEDEQDLSIGLIGDICHKNSDENDFPIELFDQYLLKLSELENIFNPNCPSRIETIHRLDSKKIYSPYKIIYNDILLLTTLIKGKCEYTATLGSNKNKFNLNEGDMILYNPYFNQTFEVSENNVCDVFHLQVKLA